MILRDLLTAIAEENQEVLDYEVLLASRSVDGKRLEGNQVILHNVGLIEIDEEEDDDEPKLKMIPLSFLDEEATAEDLRTVADILQWANAHGEGREDFALYAVVRKGVLPDERIVTLNVPFVGSLVDIDARQFWLLCYPRKHWPQEWFAT